MLTPFTGAFTEPHDDAPAPEVVPIHELSEPAIRAAAAEIAEEEAAEDEWPATA